MKTNKKFLTILTLCIALLLTACGATDAACISRRTRFLQIMRLYGTRYSA